MKNGLFFFLIFALIGTAMGAAAVYQQWSYEKIKQHGVRAKGIVVRMVYSQNTAAPVIEYYTPEHEQRTYTGTVFSSPPAYKEGEVVTLWYDPNDPSKVMLNGFDQWFLPAIFGFFFLVFGSVGYGGLIFMLVGKDRAAA